MWARPARAAGSLFSTVKNEGTMHSRMHQHPFPLPLPTSSIYVPFVYRFDDRSRHILSVIQRDAFEAEKNDPTWHLYFFKPSNRIDIRARREGKKKSSDAFQSSRATRPVLIRHFFIFVAINHADRFFFLYCPKGKLEEIIFIKGNEIPLALRILLITYVISLPNHEAQVPTLSYTYSLSRIPPFCCF